MGSRNFQLLEVRDNQSSTGLGSGALQVSGGIYAGGTSSYFSGNVNIAANNSFLTGYASYLTLAYAGSASSTTGSIVSAGGAYFGNNSVVNGTLTVTGAASAIVLLGTENATSATQGAFLCSGGINIAKNAIIVGEMGTYTYLGGSYLITFNNGSATFIQNTAALQLGYMGGRRYRGYAAVTFGGGSAVPYNTFGITFPMTFQQASVTDMTSWTQAGIIGTQFIAGGFTDSTSNGLVVRLSKSGIGGPSSGNCVISIFLII